jgi:hypothetical protein
MLPGAARGRSRAPGRRGGLMADAGHAERPAAAPPAAARFPVPEGKRLLFCVGAQKAGTTWLSRNLAAHPDCHFFPFEKELHHFDVAHGVNTAVRRWRLRHLRALADKLEEAGPEEFGELVRRMQGNLDLLKIFRPGPAGARAWMSALSRGAGRARWLCDFTPDYANLPGAAFAEMAACRAPDGGRPRFVFLMRDPVDRHWSYLRMFVAHRGIPEGRRKAKLRQMLQHDAADPELWRRKNNDYRRTIAMLETVAPPDDVLTMFYEELFSQRSYDRVCDFLGIERRPVDPARIHEGAVSMPLPPRMFAPLRRNLGPTYDFAFQRFGDAVPARWRREAA